MPEERMVKKVYKWKRMLTRTLGRRNNRWEDNIRNDMKKLKIKNWTSRIQDRNKWKLYVERAKCSKIEVVAPKEERRYWQPLHILGNSWMQSSSRNPDNERKKGNNDNKSVCMISMQYS